MIFRTKILGVCASHTLFPFIFLFLAVSILTQAQEIREFNDSYTLENDLEGEAIYNYYLSGSDTIKQGGFFFQHSETDLVDERQTIISIILSGQYTKNVKNGAWSYGYKEFRPEGQPVTTDSEIIYNATGKDYTARTFFKNSKVHGNYEIQERTIANSVTTDTLFFLKAFYEEGVMLEVIEGKKDNVRVSGRFNSQGMPDGKWEILHRTDSGDLLDVREYEDGILSSHHFVHNNEKYQINYVGMDSDPETSNQNWEEVVAGPEYFRLLSYASVGLNKDENKPENLGDPMQLVQIGNSLLEKVFFNVDVHGGRKIWELSDGGYEMQPVLVKLRKYPLSEEERIVYSEALKLLEATQNDIDTYLDDPYVKIGLHAYQDIHFYYEVMKIFQEKVETLAPLVNLLSDQATQYLNREAIIKETLPYINYPEEVQFEFDNTVITDTFPFPQGISQNNVTMTEINAHLGEIFKIVTDISETSANILEDYKSQSELPKMEAELLSKKDSIVNLFMNKTPREEYNTWHEAISSSVQEFAEQEFKNYAALPLTEKVTKIDEISSCFDSLFALYTELEDLPRKLDRINEVYTRTTWNPFTFTYMDERVKENVYEAFENEVFPFVWDELSGSISCENIGDKTKSLEVLYRKMIELRDEDTKQIERQLRRSNTLEEILAALNLDLH